MPHAALLHGEGTIISKDEIKRAVNPYFEEVCSNEDICSQNGEISTL